MSARRSGPTAVYLSDLIDLNRPEADHRKPCSLKFLSQRWRQHRTLSRHKDVSRLVGRSDERIHLGFSAWVHNSPYLGTDASFVAAMSSRARPGLPSKLAPIHESHHLGE